MSWTDQPIHFLDFEGSRASGVLEYGVATLAGGRVEGTRTRICGATGDIRPEEAAVHGLGAGAVADHPPLSADWDYFAGLRERGPFAAHYAGVENGLLKSVWPYPRLSPDFARPGGRVLDWGPWIDSARLCAQLLPGAGSGALERMVDALDAQAELDALAAAHCPPGRRRYHAALYDALAGALLLVHLARDPRWARLSLVQVLALSTLDPGRRDSLTQGRLW
jgi:DNA polymerase-3 subunit epsilon